MRLYLQLLHWEWLLESVVASLQKIIGKEHAILKYLLCPMKEKEKSNWTKEKKKIAKQNPKESARNDWI